jgi:hypothetical protein
MQNEIDSLMMNNVVHRRRSKLKAIPKKLLLKALSGADHIQPSSGDE